MRTRASGSSRGTPSDHDNGATPSPLSEEQEEDLRVSQEALYGEMLPIRGDQAKK